MLMNNLGSMMKAEWKGADRLLWLQAHDKNACHLEKALTLWGMHGNIVIIKHALTNFQTS
jgi:hypothetical protein